MFGIFESDEMSVLKQTLKHKENEIEELKEKLEIYAPTEMGKLQEEIAKLKEQVRGEKWIEEVRADLDSRENELKENQNELKENQKELERDRKDLKREIEVGVLKGINDHVSKHTENIERLATVAFTHLPQQLSITARDKQMKVAAVDEYRRGGGYDF